MSGSQSIKEEKERRNEMNAKTECVWTQDGAYDGDADYNTSCGEMFTFIDGTPKGNGMKFCCYCGLPLVEKLYEPEPEEE